MIIIHSLEDDSLVRLLQNGAIGILPTDTVYGIAARAADPAAVAMLYRAKHREGKPGTVIAATIDQLYELGIDPELLSQVAQLWPDALSVVLPDHPDLAYLDQGRHSLAVRIPRAPAIHELLLKTGPLLTSSANMPGQPVATTTREARDYFGDTVDFYVQGDHLVGGQPSTIIRLSRDGDIEVLRQGAVQLKGNRGEL